MHESKRTSRRAQTRLQPEEDPEFQIAPMIDILLVLLVFFMSISSTEVLQANQEVQLPVAADAKPAKDNPGQTTINVEWGFNNVGEITVDEKVYPQAADLVPLLQRKLSANPMTRVLIRADRSVRYEYMRSILQAVGSAGVSNITFSVVNQEAPKAQ
jgi:biopolymer transport protein ExbD